MLDFRDLMSWDRFVTPSIIRTVYGLVVGFIALIAIAGILSALLTMATNPFIGFVWLLANIVGALVGVVGARVASETVLILFRINEQLGAIRDDRRL